MLHTDTNTVIHQTNKKKKKKKRKKGPGNSKNGKLGAFKNNL